MTMPKQRLACDRCHALKERCMFRSNTPASACSRCSRLATQCTTSRRKNEVGRPRKPETASTEPQAGAEFVWFGCSLPDREQHTKTSQIASRPSPTSQPSPVQAFKGKRKESAHHRGGYPQPVSPPLISKAPSHPLLLAVASASAGRAGEPALTAHEIALLHNYVRTQQSGVLISLSPTKQINEVLQSG